MQNKHQSAITTTTATKAATANTTAKPVMVNATTTATATALLEGVFVLYSPTKRKRKKQNY